MIRVCETGRNPTMRQLQRTHRVSIDWLHEVTSKPDIHVLYEESERQAADIYTKSFTNPERWRNACELIGIFDGASVAALSLEGVPLNKKTPFFVPKNVDFPPCDFIDQDTFLAGGARRVTPEIVESDHLLAEFAIVRDLPAWIFVRTALFRLTSLSGYSSRR